MKRVWGLLIFALPLFSCNYFETQKIDAQTIYEEEMATINWEEVDEYPLFAACDETQSKERQLSCFHNQVSSRISKVLNDSIKGVIQPVNDTVYMQMKIDTTGLFSLQKVKMDSLTHAHLPRLENWLEGALGQIEAIDPATKKGVPVATLYTLPLVLVTD